MKAFAYVNAANEKEAVAALGRPSAASVLPLAGGMDLLGADEGLHRAARRARQRQGPRSTITAPATAG